MENSYAKDGIRRIYAQLHTHVLGKEIPEWSSTPEEAYDKALSMNKKYFLDERDPNSYVDVAWVFGKVRYMAPSGLERKCDIRNYALKWITGFGRSRQLNAGKYQFSKNEIFLGYTNMVGLNGFSYQIFFISLV